MDQLDIDKAAVSSEAFEIARIIVDPAKGPVFILRTEVWDDPAAWGILLVDFAKHIANAHAREDQSAEEILSRIRDGLIAEWDSTGSS